MSETQPITKKYLASYVSLKLEYDNQMERLERMKNDAKIPAIKQGGESQRTQGTGDSMERAIIRYMEYEERNGPQIAQCKAEMQAIEDAINSLSDPLEREVLRLRYIDGEYCRLMKWKKVALQMFGGDDERHLLAVHRLHDKALQSIMAIKI